MHNYIPSEYTDIASYYISKLFHIKILISLNCQVCITGRTISYNELLKTKSALTSESPLYLPNSYICYLPITDDSALPFLSHPSSHLRPCCYYQIRFSLSLTLKTSLQKQRKLLFKGILQLITRPLSARHAYKCKY